MNYKIEYSGGRGDSVWHGSVVVSANDALEAAGKIENDMACIPANVDAIYLMEDGEGDSLWTGNKELDRLRSLAASSSTGCISVSIEELNRILPRS